MKQATTIAALLLCAAAAHAQTVYRCGNEYSQRPCANATTIEVADARSDEQAQASRDKAQREAKLAQQMEKDRLAQEKRMGGPVKMVIGLPAEQPKAAVPAAKHPKKHGKGKKEPEHFTAVSPAPHKKSSR